MSIKKCSFYLQNSDLLVHLDHKALQKIFTGSTDNTKCNTWGLEAATIPRHVKLQHIKGIANNLSWFCLKTQGSRTLPWLLLPEKPTRLWDTLWTLAPHWINNTFIVVHKILIENHVETLENQVTASQADYPNLPLEDIAPEDAPHLEQKLMSLPELTPDKITPLQQKDTLFNNIVTHLHCNPHEKYFTDSVRILHKKVLDLNSTLSSVVVPKNTC